ncbi:MAG: bifunctional nicotinamidase/pyrazinamidase, partial [Bradymonadaceae bacterium]
MRALIVVDVQNCFMPDGSLPVRDGYAVVPIINELMDRFELVVATQDWHPPDHGSFASNNPGAKPGEIRELDGLDQIMWPDHCVQNTKGAEFAEGLRTERFDKVFQKGTDPKVDSYSGFYDNVRRHATGLADFLRGRGVDEVYVCGVATDYCVKFTVLDALFE